MSEAGSGSAGAGVCACMVWVDKAGTTGAAGSGGPRHTALCLYILVRDLNILLQIEHVCLSVTTILPSFNWCLRVSKCRI